MMSMAELSAWTMFMWAMFSALLRHGACLPVELALLLRIGRHLPTGEIQQLLALAHQVWRHFLVNVLEHRGRIERRSFGQCPVARRFLPTRGDMGLQLFLECRMPLF